MHHEKQQELRKAKEELQNAKCAVRLITETHVKPLQQESERVTKKKNTICDR